MSRRRKITIATIITAVVAVGALAASYIGHDCRPSFPILNPHLEIQSLAEAESRYGSPKTVSGIGPAADLRQIFDQRQLQKIESRLPAEALQLSVWEHRCLLRTQERMAIVSTGDGSVVEVSVSYFYH
jgi:hypothetical protein